MDLYSATAVYPFASPELLGVFVRHISMQEETKNSDDLFRRVFNLPQGKLVLLAPLALFDAVQ